MSAGNATPSDAITMWKPSVNAIWLRAASSADASGSVEVTIPAAPWSAGGRRASSEADEAPDRASAAPVGADEHADHGDQVELAGEHLRDRDGPADRGRGGEVPEAGGGQHGEAEVRAGAL